MYCQMFLCGKSKRNGSSLAFFRSNRQSQIQAFRQFFAQIKTNPGRSPADTSIAAGKTAVAYAGQFMGRDADPVVFYG